MPQQSKSLLQRQFENTEKELKKYSRGSLTPEELRERRRLRTLLRNLGTKLGTMSPSDKRMP